jgi:hypothetical protein
MGCSTQEVSTINSTAEPTPVVNVAATISDNLTIIPTATPMPIRAITLSRTPTPEPTVEEFIPDWTPEPEVIPPTESNTENINFTKYVSRDFMAVYPSTWTVVNETFQMKDTTLYTRDIYQTDARMVTFTSEDEKLLMKVIIYDFITPGKYDMQPTIDKSRKAVALLFPDINSETAVYNFKYAQNEQRVFVASDDVIIPKTSMFYPYSYTEQSWVTWNHLFNVDFISRTGDLDTYKELKYRMLSSIVTEGPNRAVWW